MTMIELSHGPASCSAVKLRDSWAWRNLITDAASMSVKELKIFLYGAVALGGLVLARDRVELRDVFETFAFELFEVVDAFETLEALDAFDALDALEAFDTLDALIAAGDTAIEDCLTAEIGV
jgi:hypothetical protein